MMRSLLLSLLLAPVAMASAQTGATLARLAVRVDPQHRSEFHALFEESIRPLLLRHGVVEVGDAGRPTVDSTYCRVLRVAAPEAIPTLRKSLFFAPAWLSLVDSTTGRFGVIDDDISLRLYSTPAIPTYRSLVGTGVRQGLWHNFGVTDGLPAGGVHRMVQDADGIMWLAMETAGLCRYDGQEFFCYGEGSGLPGNDVSDLRLGADGDLWLEVTSYPLGEGRPLSFVRFDGTAFHVYTAADGVPDDCSFMAGSSADVWLVSPQAGPLRWNGESWTTAEWAREIWPRIRAAETPSELGSYSFYMDRRGALWLSTRLRLQRAIPGRLEEWPRPPTAPAWSIYEDSRGAMWFGLHGGGVARLDSNGWMSLSAQDGLTPGIPAHMSEDRNGHLWFATYGAAGVSRWDGERLHVHDTREGLINNQVRHILEDREGHLWFSTIEGISRYDGVHLMHLTTSEGLPSNGVMSAVEDSRGNMWFGTFHGSVTRYDGSRLKSFAIGPRMSTVWSVAADADGGVWAARSSHDSSAVVRIRDDEVVTFDRQHGVPEDGPYDILADADGLWLTFGRTFPGGLVRFDGAEFSTLSLMDGLPGDRLQSLHRDRDGKLWIGMFAGGVARYDGDSFEHLGTADGLAHESVWSILSDSAGALWFGTFGGGVSRFDGREFETFDRNRGLAHDYVLSIMEDRLGRLWFGTFGGGISVYDGLVFQTISRRDGLLNNAVHEIVEDSRGDYWIATEGGVSRYRPSRTPPRVQIANIIAERAHGAARQLEIDDTQDLVIFEFRGRSFTSHPDQIVYVCRLLGYDDEWHFQREPRMQYDDLGLGEYSFEVRAVDRDLNYSESASVRLTVIPAYGRWSLVAVLVITLGLVGLQGRRLVHRNRGIREANQQLSLSNRELSHEMERRERVEAERTRLDEQLEHLRFLDRLRGRLEGLRVPSEIVEVAGQHLLEVMASTAGGAVRIVLDGSDHALGDASASLHVYETTLRWGDRDRGRLQLHSAVALSESQQRALVDETAAQIVRALESQELSAQLLQSARLVSLGQMAAGVAHELNQPLSAISTVAGDLNLRLKDGHDVEDTRVQEMMERVLAMVDRMAGTIGHLRVLSRDSAQSPGEPLDLNGVVHTSLQVIGVQLANHAIELELDLEPSLPSVHGRANQLEQVLLNLLANARDAVDELAATEPEHRRKITVRTRLADDSEVVLEVEDNGTGIDGAQLGRIFDPFFTTKEVDRGTGLGLSISYAIAHDHDGRLECRSQQGVGSVFRLLLPLHQPS